MSHSLQKQVVQKSLEATKAADALKQKTAELKKLETQYVEERIRLTEQTTDLFTQVGFIVVRRKLIYFFLKFKQMKHLSRADMKYSKFLNLFFT